MEAGTTSIANAAQPNQFSRYRSVRQRGQPSPPVPEPPVPQICQDSNAEQDDLQTIPSRYRRRAATQTRHVPLPDAALPVTVPNQQPSRYHARTQRSVPQPILETASVNEPSPQPGTHVSPRSPPQAQSPPDNVPVQQETVQNASRYRSRTTASRTKQDPARASYDMAREEARLILEGEYDRLQHLKRQQEKAERERKQKAEAHAKLAAQKAEQARLDQTRSRVEAEEKQGQLEITHQQQQLDDPPPPSRTRKWTVGGGGSSHAFHPNSAPHSTPTSPQMRLVQAVKNHVSPRQGRNSQDQPDSNQTTSDEKASVGNHAPVLKKRMRGPTFSRPKETPVQPTWEPQAGNGPPKSAVNGPVAPKDAPVSAVNAGERRVEVRFEDSRITLPVTPSTTVKDLLNSASVIMSQPIDPRTSVLLETYYPLGLERPLRRYEHVRDVMNSWDSDTQNYLMIMPEGEHSAVGLEQKDTPVHQPSHKMLNIHHSQKPGKWEKHWMTLKEDGQVTASTKENDGNAVNVFHLSDFDIYTPTKKQLKKLHSPKKICFAIKSQQRSIMFESTENFVHFFSTNDRAVADQWYHAVQAWRSWYLVNVMGEGFGHQPPQTSNTTLSNPIAQARPSISHSRDSFLYQLGTFQPLLDFSADAFKYDPENVPVATKPTIAAQPHRMQTLVDRARNKSVDDSSTKITGLQRRSMTKPNAQSSTSVSNTHHHKSSQSGQPYIDTNAAFTGGGLLARAFSIKKSQAEENAALYENTDNAFTGAGLLSRKLSTRIKPANEHPGHGGMIDSNDAFTGSGLMGAQLRRSLTKKKPAPNAKPGEPLLNLAANSTFEDGSLLSRVESYEIANGLAGPVIDRSKGVEVKEKVGEF